MYTMTHKTADGIATKIAIAFRYNYTAPERYMSAEFAHASIQVWYCKFDGYTNEMPSAPYWETLGGFAWQSNMTKPDDHPEAKYAHNRRGPIQPTESPRGIDGAIVMYGPLYGARLEYLEKLDYGGIQSQFAAGATLGKLWAKLEQIVTKYNLDYRWPEDEFCPIVAAARVLGIADFEIDAEYHRNVYDFPLFYSSLSHDA